jgi:hypothetical protein
MMIGMNAAEVNMMAGDFIDLLNSPDATDITMTWETGTPHPVYPGKWVGTPTVNTQSFRGHIVLALGMGRMKPKPELESRKFADMPDADIAILMPSAISIKGLVNIKFAISGLGDFHPLEKPGSDLSHQALMLVGGQAMVQWVFAKAVK